MRWQGPGAGRRLRGILVAVAVLVAGVAGAAGPTPEALVADVYRLYLGADGPGVDLDDLDAILSPATAALWEEDRDAAEDLGEVGTIGSDPFVAGQDWSLRRLPAITVRHTGPDAAVVEATGVNDLVPGRTTVRFDMVRTPAGWRIDDVHPPDGGPTLKARLDEASRRRRTP